MFDWDQYELEDIIWGELGESDDHIVPHPKNSEENPSIGFGHYITKHRYQVSNADIKISEHKTTETKNDFLECKLPRESPLSPTEELSAPTMDMDSWSELPLSSVDRNGGDSLDTELSNNFDGVASLASIDCDMIPPPLEKLHDFSASDITQNHGNLELFGNEHHDNQGGSLFDCGWASVGSFDDVDRIFKISNDSKFELEFSSTEEELWASSAGTKMEEILCENNSLALDYNKICNTNSSRQQKIDKMSGRDGHAEDKRIPKVEEQPESITEFNGEAAVSESKIISENTAIINPSTCKIITQRKVPKCEKKVEEKSRTKTLQDLSGSTCPATRKNRNFAPMGLHVSAPSGLWVYPPPVLTAQRQVGGPSGYGYHISAMPLTPCERDQSQQVLSSCKSDSSVLFDHLKNSPYVPSKSSTMTPQEKIEKLRRRQKVRARLAVEHQQQRLGSQISCVDPSIIQKCMMANQGQDAIAEVDLKPPALQNSDNSSLLFDDSLFKEKIFAQLQDAIARLDVKMRLCIRDSLYRLARSAVQRHSVGDTSSSSKFYRDDKEEANGNAHTHEQADRCTRPSDGETDTNPIDRTVAHLLFYRPSNTHETLLSTHGR